MFLKYGLKTVRTLKYSFSRPKIFKANHLKLLVYHSFFVELELSAHGSVDVHDVFLF